MNLLVSTGPWLFHVNAETHETRAIAESLDYYGISWTYDGKQLALGHTITDSPFLTFEDYVESEKGGVALGNRSRFDCLSAPHQILCTPEHIVAANSGRNCITIFNQDDLFYYHHWFDDVRWDRKGVGKTCGSHFNSIFFKDDRLFLLAHNFENSSYVLELDWPGLEVIRRIDTCASQAHNVWPLSSGEMIVCNSAEGSLVEVTSGQTLWRNEERECYTRGLACCGKTVFVGESLIRRRRKDRLVANGRIRILDRDTWKQIDCIPMPRAGVVHEVRILDAPDECHHGHPFTGELKIEPEADDNYRQYVEGFGKTVTDDVDVRDQVWKVTQGLADVSHDHSIQTGEGSLGVAVKQGPSVADVDLTADVQLLGDEQFRHGGLVARYSGPGDENMYLGMLIHNGEARRAEIWRNIDGEWEILRGKRIRKTSGRLRFQVEGTSLVLSLNGHRVVKVRDSGITGPGKLGVRGADAAFEGFQVIAIR
jgi:hypothetical protein